MKFTSTCPASEALVCSDESSRNWLVLIKSTAIVSIIGLSDLMTRGQQAAGTTREPFSFYLAVALIYLVFTSVSELAFSWANKRLAIGVKEGSL